MKKLLLAFGVLMAVSCTVSAQTASKQHPKFSAHDEAIIAQKKQDKVLAAKNNVVMPLVPLQTSITSRKGRKN